MPHIQTKFWQELLRKLKDRHPSKTASWLACKFGVSLQTFSSWKARGQFRESLLPQLAEALPWHGLDAEQARKLGVELIGDRDTSAVGKSGSHPTEMALRQANKRYRGALRSFKRYSEETYLKVLSTLGEHCWFAFSGCMVSPFEFEDNEEGRAIVRALAKAICRGALCLYIRPTDEGLSYYEQTWGYAQAVHFQESTSQIEAFRQSIKRLMIRGEVEDMPKITSASADRLLYERLDQCYVTRSPMWMPGVGLIMIGWYHERQVKSRMAITLPGGQFGGVLIYPSYMPLEFRFTRFLRKVVSDACLEVQARKEGQSNGNVQLVMPEPEKYLSLAERFYTRYSELLRSVLSIEPPADALM